MVITATGIDGLIKNGGSMRLVLGAHDFGPDIVEAYTMSKEHANELIETIGERIAKNLESIEYIISTRRLEAMAWMFAEKGRNRLLSHQKMYGV